MFSRDIAMQAAGQGPQTVQLKNELTGEYAGEVRLTISGGSPAISGLPHTEGAPLPVDHLSVFSITQDDEQWCG